MRLDRFATLYLATPLRKITSSSNDGGVSILMYHRISDEPEPTLSPYYRVNTSPQRFAEHMQLLHEENYNVLDLADALKLLQNDSMRGKYAVITFDDGYADFQEHAFPALQKHGFTATVFLPTAYITHERTTFKNIPCLTWSEVKKLQTSGIRFGSHTVSHPKLRELDWPEIEKELRNSKAALESELQEAITTFAYPYAWPEDDTTFTRRFGHILRESGYTCCVTTKIGIAERSDDRFTLKRLPVNDCDDSLLFRAKLQGNYNWLSIPQRFRKKAARRATQPKRPIQATAIS